jgi:hypothetical protein
VYAEILRDPAFFRFLIRIDEEFAERTCREGCRRCAGPLHVSDFPRKPRGCPSAVVEEYSWRLSFTCGRCEKRTTSPSVRFLGRRLYVAVVLMLSSPPQGQAEKGLRDQLNVPSRTVQRWRRWWTRDFLRTPFWQATRSRFIPPVPGEQLPASLLERFDAAGPAERLSKALRFLSPLSIPPVGVCADRTLSRRGCR